MARRRAAPKTKAPISRFRKCEFYPESGKKTRCANPADVFVMGDWRCRSHLPPPQPKCSHSLAPGGRCAYCGQEAT